MRNDREVICEDMTAQIKSGQDNNSYRYVLLNDGTGMGGERLLFRTNAPENRLKELERLSNEEIRKGDDAPIWSIVLSEEGYVFECLESHQHVTAFGTSTEWAQNHTIASNVTEVYTIDDSDIMDEI